MSGWFRTTSILTNPSGVPIVSFSSCLPTEAALSIPKIWPPAFCTTWPYLLSASAKLNMSLNLTIRIDSGKDPLCFHRRLHFLDGHRRPPAAPWLQSTTGDFLVQLSPRARAPFPKAARAAGGRRQRSCMWRRYARRNRACLPLLRLCHFGQLASGDNTGAKPGPNQRSAHLACPRGRTDRWLTPLRSHLPARHSASAATLRLSREAGLGGFRSRPVTARRSYAAGVRNTSPKLPLHGRCPTGSAGLVSCVTKLVRRVSTR